MTNFTLITVASTCTLLLILYYFLFFKKKKIFKLIKDNLEDESFRKEYLKISSDIKYIESKFDSYITNSLNSEFDIFKDYYSDNLTAIYNTNKSYNIKHWYMYEYSHNNFFLIKNQSVHKCIQIKISYKFIESECHLSIRDISIIGPGKIKETKELVNVISKYILHIQMELKKRENKKIQTQLNDIVNIVGKDVVRDKRIDELLKNI